MQNLNMKTFIAEYNWHGSWGAYEWIAAVVVEENEEKALERALRMYPRTTEGRWEFEEINTKEAEFHGIMSGGS